MGADTLARLPAVLENLTGKSARSTQSTTRVYFAAGIRGLEI